ncbi:MAG: hypothetical protein GDA50_03595 [Alphaproteobacteria bacterium GM202ARS2]|nr:hypothetical protein [Alphaproteobacteria bacterium GM202ARS2]
MTLFCLRDKCTLFLSTVLLTVLLLPQPTLAADGACKIDEKASIGIICGDASLALSGRIHIDYLAFSRDDSDGALTDPINSGRASANDRRTRIALKGKVNKVLGYKFGYDFTSSTPIKDMYLNIKMSALNLRLGQFKMPFSLAEMTSSRFYPFTERPLTDDNVAIPGRKMGVGLFTKGSQWTWGMALHTDNYRNDDNRTESLFGFVTRLTYAPWLEAKKGNYVHLGIGYRNASNLEGNPAQQDFDGHSPFSSAVLGTDIYSVKGQGLESFNVFNPEVAVGWGALGIQGELWTMSSSAEVSAHEVDMTAFYIQGLVWLTGEANAYKDGAFKRVKPLKPLGEGGIGALGFAVRYQNTAFEADRVVGGGDKIDRSVNAVSIAALWRMHAHVQLSFEYAFATRDIDGTETKPKGFQMRLGIDW